jgi:hypothetical protein
MPNRTPQTKGIISGDIIIITTQSISSAIAIVSIMIATTV